MIQILMLCLAFSATATETPAQTELGKKANVARRDFLKWFHKDAMEISQKHPQDALAKKLLNIDPSEGKERIPRVLEGLQQKVLQIDSIQDRDTQSCLIQWAHYWATKNSAIFELFKKKGIFASNATTAGDDYIEKTEAYVLKTYPETSCAKDIAFDRGYCLQYGPSCEIESLDSYQHRMDKSKLPLQLPGQKLSAKEKALAQANIAYAGEWAWDSLREKNPPVAEGYKKSALEALLQMNDLLPESKKWNDIRIEALKQNAGSVMQDCTVPGD